MLSVPGPRSECDARYQTQTQNFPIHNTNTVYGKVFPTQDVLRAYCAIRDNTFAMGTLVRHLKGPTHAAKAARNLDCQ